MHDLGFNGAEILTNVDGCELSDASLEPFWKKAEQIGALIDSTEWLYGCKAVVMVLLQ